jgi:hypothetical protein
LKEGVETGKKSLKGEVMKRRNCLGEGVTTNWNNQTKFTIIKNCQKKRGKKGRNYLGEGVMKSRNYLEEVVIKAWICLEEGVAE